jgi:hypothetical protein
LENKPAAAAASGLIFLIPSPEGLSVEFARSIGLLLRLEESGLREGGDLDRLSNREERAFGSGSVWSKRERFADLLSVSSIF